MSFDKVKAMRNAERFLAQGKNRAAINEYKRVIENDPKDFSTLNMLGDMYAKASEDKEAVKCFTQVAEHYSKQGFAQKAIAIYNKISRLMPESLEVSAKLAQLYQMKGSVAEARSHYNVLAEQYTRTGRKAEALMVWNQIAKLDPSNTDICLKIADAYWQDEQKDEALNAYIEAGKRLSAKRNYDSSVTVFSRALEIKPNDLIAVRGFIDAQINLGYTDEAAKKLVELLEDQPYNREIIYLLVDCYLDMNNPGEAEKALIKLVEQEPSSYPKCIDLVKTYLKSDDLEAAARVLNIASEHLLVGGQAEELEKWINEILAKNPEQVDALRLLVRFHTWQRDEAELRVSLERLAEAAKINNAGEDERFALSQLVMICPQNAEVAERLQELNKIFGNSDVYYEPPTHSLSSGNEIPTFESYARLTEDYENDSPVGNNFEGYEEFSGDLTYVNGNGDAHLENSAGNDYSNGFDEYEGAVKDGQPIEIEAQVVEDSGFRKLSEVEEYNLQKEIDSVNFYIEQGYTDLAEKSILELEARFGKNESIEKLRDQLNIPSANSIEEDNGQQTVGQEVVNQFTPNEIVAEPMVETEKFDPMADFRSEIGFEEAESVEEGDYDTHYHMGIAYKEMGLTEDSIREFQDAIKFANPDDGTRRFFLCCNLLGHCFMERNMPNLALMWFKRAMEAKNLNSEELKGLRYELANAFELGGDKEKALEYFEEIYANNVDYRDVSKRVQDLQK